MQNKNTISLKINTGVTFFTAVYEREYKADIYVQDDKVYLQDVRSVDYVPSGYGQGGSAKHYAEEFLCKGCKLTHVAPQAVFTIAFKSGQSDTASEPSFIASVSRLGEATDPQSK